MRDICMQIPKSIYQTSYLLPSDFPNNFSWACPHLKFLSTIFYQIFIFHQSIALKNYEKCFLFNLKSSFCSWDIQIFVFSSSPLFFPVSHCFRRWSKKNLKIYDVINSVNKNLITHFVLYLQKEVRYDIETLSIDKELNKEYLWKNHAENMHQKLAPVPF